jgi:hypothetical protein
MKLRKFEFKSVPISDEVWNESKGEMITVVEGTFHYRDIIRQILNSPGRQGSMGSEEVMKSVMIYGKVKEAISKSSDCVLLDGEEYEYLKSRMEQFPWARSHKTIGEFITYVRGLTESDYDATFKEIVKETPAAS